MRWGVVAGALGLGIASTMVMADDARACGGCFHGPTESEDVITDHRMIFRVTPEQTSLYDEIEYQGTPAGFAWVLPIHGQVDVGLSADVLFAAMDQATTTTIQSPAPPACPSCSCNEGFGAAGASDASASGSSSGGSTGVNVISQSVVGPYDTVQLSSTNPTALTDWLTANGYSVPSDVAPILAAYVSEGFDFLALKLQPGQGVQAMRPVRVTTQGAGLSLPLRMVSAGTGATVGITLWVVADGRYEAANFPNFVIAPSQLVWDFSTETSNYTTLRQQTESDAGFATWQTESSLDVTPYQIEDSVLADQASDDYLPTEASDAGGEGGAGETADQVRQDDLATIFPDGDQSSVRITRMRADLAHAALANDLNLQASADQSDLSNIYNVTSYVNAPACPAVPNPCPPCGNGSSGGSYGGSTSSSGSGATTTSASPGQSSFGCSTSPADGGGGWLEAALAGLIGLAFVRGRSRRKR